jgi:hypothetical protein
MTPMPRANHTVSRAKPPGKTPANPMCTNAQDARKRTVKNADNSLVSISVSDKTPENKGKRAFG